MLRNVRHYVTTFLAMIFAFGILSGVLHQKAHRQATILLCTAVTAEDNAPLQELLGEGANPDGGDEADYTPLMCAASTSNIEAMRCLLQSGANINAQRNGGQTALMTAVKFRRVAAVRFLLEHHANSALRDADGLTAQDWAVKQSCRDIAALLGTV